jgi:hypothetical protein
MSDLRLHQVSLVSRDCQSEKHIMIRPAGAKGQMTQARQVPLTPATRARDNAQKPSFMTGPVAGFPGGRGADKNSMHWVRTKRRFGAWCALLAITLQIVLSFGHTHRFDGFRPGTFAPQAIVAVQDQPVAEASNPASKPAGLALEYCAVCAVIEIGASAVPAATPSYFTPVAAGRVRFASYAEAAASTLERLPFAARGPPSV